MLVKVGDDGSIVSYKRRCSSENRASEEDDKLAYRSETQRTSIRTSLKSALKDPMPLDIATGNEEVKTEFNARSVSRKSSGSSRKLGKNVTFKM